VRASTVSLGRPDVASGSATSGDFCGDRKPTSHNAVAETRAAAAPFSILERQTQTDGRLTPGVRRDAAALMGQLPKS